MNNKQKKRLLNIVKSLREYEIRTDDEESKSKKNSFGNTRIPFGLCKEFGIQVGKDWTPRDAWEALEDASLTSRDEVYETLKKKKSLKDFKEGYKSDAPRSMSASDFGSLVKKGKSKKLKDEIALDKLSDEINKRYSIRGDQSATDLFKSVGKLHDASGNKTRIEFSEEMPELGKGLYYYSSKKGKLKFPSYREKGSNHFFVAGACSAVASYLDTLLGEDGKTASESDKGLIEAIEASSSVDVSSLENLSKLEKNLEDHANRPRLRASATKGVKFIEEQTAEDAKKVKAGEMTEYAYRKKQLSLLDTAPECKGLREYESRNDRLSVCHSFTKAFAETLASGTNTSSKAKILFSTYMSLAQTEPRAIEYLRKDLPEVCSAMDSLIDRMNESVTGKMESTSEAETA